MTIDTRASTSLRGRATSAAPHASRTIRRLTLVLMVALLALLAGGQRAHAQTPTSFTGDGDTQAQYMTPGCFGSPSTAGTPCLIGTAGSGLATLGDSQFFFHYLLTQTVTLSQVTYTDRARELSEVRE